MPGITKRSDHKKVNKLTKKFTLNADQKSSNPQKESPTSGLLPAETFKYTRIRLNVKAGAIIIELAKEPTTGINDKTNDARRETTPIISVITNRIPIFPLICNFACDFKSALFVKISFQFCIYFIIYYSYCQLFCQIYQIYRKNCRFISDNATIDCLCIKL